jgi:hypothetical protein
MSQTKVKSGLLNFPDQTDFVKLPSGTTAQRPSSPEKGYSRYNTTDNKLEYWNGTIWSALGSTLPIVDSLSYLNGLLAVNPVGGDTIVINGSNFEPGIAVFIGGETCPSVSYVSSSQIQAVTPQKQPGDYDLILSNPGGASATLQNSVSYNGVPEWITSSGSLGSFVEFSSIGSINISASEADGGSIVYSITSGNLPPGLSLSGNTIIGTTQSASFSTTYNFTISAIDDENQSTARSFSITVFPNPNTSYDPFGDLSGKALFMFEGNTNDESNFFNGTQYGGVTYATGKLNQGAVFNKSQYIKGISINNSEVVTVSCWINIAGGYTGNESDNFIWSSGKYANGKARRGLLIRNYNLSSNYIWPLNSGTPIPDETYAITPDTWLHIVYSDDDVYLNGNHWFTMDVPMDNTADSYGFYIGGNGAYDYGYITNTTYGKPVRGSIDQLRIFNRKLTANEVSILYNSESV